MSRFIIVVMLALAVAGCNKHETRGFEKTSVATLGVADARADQSAAPQEKQQRMIVRTANLAVVVADTGKAVEKVTATAEAFGGYISNSRVWREGELLRASVSFRVPADKLTAALTAIRGGAIRIESESTTSDEVTEEFIDLEARLRTLEATENELKILMVNVRERTRKASDVLEMHQQLMNIRTEIERVQGRIRYLRQMTAFATANVELIPDAIAKPVVEPGWQPLVIVEDAGRSLVKALQAVVSIVIWALIYFVPILLIVAMVALISRRAITLLWKMRRSASL